MSGGQNWHDFCSHIGVEKWQNLWWDRPPHCTIQSLVILNCSFGHWNRFCIIWLTRIQFLMLVLSVLMSLSLMILTRRGTTLSLLVWEGRTWWRNRRIWCSDYHCHHCSRPWRYFFFTLKKQKIFALTEVGSSQYTTSLPNNVHTSKSITLFDHNSYKL